MKDQKRFAALALSAIMVVSMAGNVYAAKEIKSKDDLAKLLHYDQSYISRILRLTNLSPHIVRLFINGQAPSGLSLTTLHKAFPDDWNEQHEFFKIG